MDTIEARIREINEKAPDADRVTERALGGVIAAVWEFRPEGSALEEAILQAFIADKRGDDITTHLNSLKPPLPKKCPLAFGPDKVQVEVIKDMDDAFNVPDEPILDTTTCSECKEDFPDYYIQDGLCFECKSSSGFDKDGEPTSIDCKGWQKLTEDILLWMMGTSRKTVKLDRPQHKPMLTFKQFQASLNLLTRQVGHPGDGNSMTGGKASNINDLIVFEGKVLRSVEDTEGKPITRQAMTKRVEAFEFAADFVDKIRKILYEAFPDERNSEKALCRVDSVRDWLFLKRKRPEFLELEVLQRQALNEKLNKLKKKNGKKLAQVVARCPRIIEGLQLWRKLQEHVKRSSGPVFPESPHLKHRDDVYDDFKSDPSQ